MGYAVPAAMGAKTGFVVGKDAMVWPMVAAGTSNDEIMFARGVRPIFDEDDV
jgi:acetolactate synthase-1/2/3 large subunit